VEGTSNSRASSIDCAKEFDRFKYYFLNRATRLDRVFFVSSGGTIYGTSIKQIFCEACEVNPQTPYAIMKLEQEMFLHDFCRRFEIKLSIFRLANVYSQVSKSVIKVMMEKAHTNSPFEYQVNPESRKQYGFADDYARFISSIIASQLLLRDMDSTILNIYSPFTYSLLDIQKMIEESTGRPLRVNLNCDALPDETVILETIWDWANPNSMVWKPLGEFIRDHFSNSVG
jgi:nucleoside-diphosphate-sugar epimerase